MLSQIHITSQLWKAQRNVPEIVDLEQEKTSIESNPQYHATANEDKDELGNFLRPEDLDNHSLDLHIADDNFEVPMLEQVHAAILSAGETGIKIGDSIEIIRAEGKELFNMYVYALSMIYPERWILLYMFCLNQALFRRYADILFFLSQNTYRWHHITYYSVVRLKTLFSHCVISWLRSR